MAITTMDGLVTALANASIQSIYLPSATNVASGWVWLNYATTSSFGVLAIPAASTSGGTAYTQTAGTSGYPKWTAVGSTTAYIALSQKINTVAGVDHVYDLFWACSGFNGTLTTAQTVTTPVALPTRAGTGVNTELWVYCTTALGATASNITVQYTNSSGVSGRSTVSTAMIASMPAFRMFMVPLQAGDTGVQSIQSITLSVSTGTAGSFGVLIAKKLFSHGNAVVNVETSKDFAGLGLPKIYDESVLMFINQSTTTSSGIGFQNLSIIHG
jgi:hypothetical protein